MTGNTRHREGIWKNEDTLRGLYIDGNLTQSEIAERLGCSQRTIQYWMGKFGIESRDSTEHFRNNWASYYTKPDGYEAWVVENPQTEKSEIVYVHRLLAVAEHGFGALKNRIVHHKNGIPWDNRPNNIELMTQSEHASGHWDPEVHGAALERARGRSS